MNDSSTEALAKELFATISKPSIVAKLLIQNPNILHYEDPQKGNALQAALRGTVNNENCALAILNYSEAHHMICSQEEDILSCPFFMAITKGYHNCVSIMCNTKQGKYILDKYPHKTLLSAIHSGPKMVAQMLQYPQVSRILNHPIDSEGNTILHFTVKLNKPKCIDIVKTLVSFGSDPCLFNKLGKRASMLTKNDQVWNYLRKCEAEREVAVRQDFDETIQELKQQNVSKESYIHQILNETKSKEQLLHERIKELEEAAETARLRLSEELARKTDLVETQREELKVLSKEKDSLLKAIHMKSEEHVEVIHQIQRKHTKELEQIRADINSMSKAILELAQNFQHTRNNMIGLQNESLKAFQQQQTGRFNTVQTELTELQNAKVLHEGYHKETKEAMTKLEERQKEQFTEFKDDTDQKIRKFKQEEDEKINQIKKDQEIKINTFKEDQETRLNDFKKDREYEYESFKFKVEDTLQRKEKKDQAQFDLMTDKIDTAQKMTEIRTEKISNSLKQNSEDIGRIQTDLLESSGRFDNYKLESEFKFTELTKRHEGSVQVINEQLKSHDNQLKGQSDQISNLNIVVEQNRNNADVRCTIVEDRIGSLSVEIGNTNNRLSDQVKKQQQDKQNIYDEIEKDRSILREQQDRIVSYEQRTDGKIAKVTELISSNSTLTSNKQIETDKKLAEQGAQIHVISTKITTVETTVKETTQSLSEDIQNKKKEDNRRFDTLFERLENNDYYQNEKIHEVVIEKMMEEKKKQLHQLEKALFTTQTLNP